MRKTNKPILDEVDLKILNLFKSSPEYTMMQIVSCIRLTHQNSKKHIDKLVLFKLLKKERYVGNHVSFFINNEGRTINRIFSGVV